MISIITPVYNGERFIESCIKNVIDQNCPDVEHLIIDGGSTDRTVETVKCYAETYPHIRWISEQDRGQSDAMNKGIAMARGEIVGFLNVDDFYEINVLNRVSELFLSLPDPSFLVGNCKVLDDSGNLIHLNKPNNLRASYIYFSITELPFNPSAYFYHKSLHLRAGMYDINEHYAMDTAFIIRALRKANLKYVNETWGNYRQIEGTKTVSLLEKGKLVKKHREILNAHFNDLPIYARLLISADAFYLFKIKKSLRNVAFLKSLWEILKGGK